MSNESTPLMLQDLIEKVMILKKAVEREKRQADSISCSSLAEQLRFVRYFQSIFQIRQSPSLIRFYFGTLEFYYGCYSLIMVGCFYKPDCSSHRTPSVHWLFLTIPITHLLSDWPMSIHFQV